MAQTVGLNDESFRKSGDSNLLITVGSQNEFEVGREAKIQKHGQVAEQFTPFRQIGFFILRIFYYFGLMEKEPVA